MLANKIKSGMPLPQVVGTMKELYSFMAGSSATLDVFVNNEVPDGAHTAEACPCQLWNAAATPSALPDTARGAGAC